MESLKNIFAKGKGKVKVSRIESAECTLVYSAASGIICSESEVMVVSKNPKQGKIKVKQIEYQNHVMSFQLKEKKQAKFMLSFWERIALVFGGTLTYQSITYYNDFPPKNLYIPLPGYVNDTIFECLWKKIAKPKIKASAEFSHEDGEKVFKDKDVSPDQITMRVVK